MICAWTALHDPWVTSIARALGRKTSSRKLWIARRAKLAFTGPNLRMSNRLT